MNAHTDHGRNLDIDPDANEALIEQMLLLESRLISEYAPRPGEAQAHVRALIQRAYADQVNAPSYEVVPLLVERAVRRALDREATIRSHAPGLDCP